MIVRGSRREAAVVAGAAVDCAAAGGAGQALRPARARPAVARPAFANRPARTAAARLRWRRRAFVSSTRIWFRFLAANIGGPISICPAGSTHGAATPGRAQSIEIRRSEGRAAGTRRGAEFRWMNSASVVRYRNSAGFWQPQQRRRGEQRGVRHRDDGADRAAVIGVAVGILVGRCGAVADEARRAAGWRRTALRAPHVATPWKCPNDSTNWIASANSASLEPCLMFERNHFMPKRTPIGRPGVPAIRCYIITSGMTGGCQLWCGSQGGGKHPPV